MHDGVAGELVDHVLADRATGDQHDDAGGDRADADVAQRDAAPAARQDDRRGVQADPEQHEHDDQFARHARRQLDGLELIGVQDLDPRRPRARPRCRRSCRAEVRE